MADTASLAQGCGLVVRSARSVVRVTGKDRLDYLQRMTTQDLHGLSDGAAAPTCVLDARGRVLGDPVVQDWGDCLVLEMSRLAAVNADYDTWLAASRARLLRLTRFDRIDHRAAVDAAFHAHIERYVRVAEPLHEKIVNFNVMCPIHRLEKVNIWVDHLVERMEGRYAKVCDELGWAAPQPRPVTQTRKKAARQRAESRAHHVLDLVRSAAELRAIVQPARIVPRPGPRARWWSLLRWSGK